MLHLCPLESLCYFHVHRLPVGFPSHQPASVSLFWRTLLTLLEPTQPVLHGNHNCLGITVPWEQPLKGLASSTSSFSISGKDSSEMWLIYAVSGVSLKYWVKYTFHRTCLILYLYMASFHFYSFRGFLFFFFFLRSAPWNPLRVSF